MKIGVIGGGVVGSAIARCYLEHVEEIKICDELPERSTHNKIQTLQTDLIFVCLPENRIDSFFQDDILPFCEDWKGYNYVLKSTVPIGTTRRLREQYGVTNLVHSPEFLTARCAFADVQCPAVNIIGDPSSYDMRRLGDGVAILESLYLRRFPGVQILHMSSNESEAIKLFLNSFFAVKVSYFNEIRMLADKLGLDWETVRAGMLADGRIAHAHTQVPGPDGLRGFGGACLPKDLIALCNHFGVNEVNDPVIHAAQHWIRRQP